MQFTKALQAIAEPRCDDFSADVLSRGDLVAAVTGVIGEFERFAIQIREMVKKVPYRLAFARDATRLGDPDALRSIGLPTRAYNVHRAAMDGVEQLSARIDWRSSVSGTLPDFHERTANDLLRDLRVTSYLNRQSVRKMPYAHVKGSEGLIVPARHPCDQRSIGQVLERAHKDPARLIPRRMYQKRLRNRLARTHARFP